MASRTARKNLASLDATARRLATTASTSSPPAASGRSSATTERQAPASDALGHVPDAHLPGLYAGASAFVLPSWHEGFGLTCIEAMACGVPVVAARAGALPETCGDAARYADPFDHDDIADPGPRPPSTTTRCAPPGPRHAAPLHAGSARPASSTRS